ncbi:MAG: hypothetical protein JJ900_08635 [Rhodospirillales bacterium]|nr:hypothetical protein [Rhodospirillales bacterium]MBO6786904.1 hypothetical protein [Rhodospirillales bacterium]
MRSHVMLAALAALSLLLPGPLSADEPAVLDVTAFANPDGTYGFNVTVTHRDEGWSHYADKWEVIGGSDNRVLGTRTLYHPHVDEQPFTRTLSHVEVPIGVTQVTVRAYCNTTGVGARTFTVTLPPRK